MLFIFLHQKQAEVQSAPVTKATKQQKYEWNSKKIGSNRAA